MRGRRGSPDWAASCELGAGDRHDLVVELAESPSATLRDALAGALGIRPSRWASGLTSPAATSTLRAALSRSPRREQAER